MSLISDQNDRFRQQILSDPAIWPVAERIPGKVIMTPGVAQLPNDDLQMARDLVRTFRAFTVGDDPYGEHDVGIVRVGDKQLIWKIDYYDLRYEHGSDDPSDVNQTRRVLTIMLATEY